MTARISIQREDFDVQAEAGALARGRTDIGAVVTFSGLVRADDGLASLTLEHYPGMTETRDLRPCRRGGEPLAAPGRHRDPSRGPLLPGEAIVLVAVAAAHRQRGLRSRRTS